MKIPKIAKAMEHIDEDLIAEALGKDKKTQSRHILKGGAVAACLALILIAGSITVPLLMKNKAKTEDGLYKNFAVRIETSTILWPWDDLTVCEKYTETEIDGVKYLSRGSEVTKDLVGESLGVKVIAGFDEINDRKYTAEAEVFLMKGIAKNQFIAVKLEGSYYVFKNDKYAPPKTLGELFEEVPLDKLIELKRFSENGDGPDSDYFTLDGDGYLWQLLAECGNAHLIKDDLLLENGDYISFTVSSEAIGVYKRVLYITADGYLWTNAFDYGYTYNIGKDAAARIIKYAKENSKKAEYEPYLNSIIGTVVEIGEEYIIIDDTVLYNDPDNGKRYKVSTDDLRISRYIDKGVIKKGHTVGLDYKGEIDRDNTVGSPLSIYRVYIQANGDAVIPE
ncbi:MAG: hypothetical protein E7597_06975 [Ruminococcaceae bacterium]|nr:hypothetical protein [Oscillospiraceae bacterium]